MQALNLAAYIVTVTASRTGLVAEVAELPGCVAAAHTAAQLEAALSEAMFLYFDDHPDAPQYYLPLTESD